MASEATTPLWDDAKQLRRRGGIWACRYVWKHALSDEAKQLQAGRNLGVSLRLEATRYGQSGVVASLATAVQRFSRPICSEAANRTPGSASHFWRSAYGVRWQAKRRHRFGMNAKQIPGGAESGRVATAGSNALSDEAKQFQAGRNLGVSLRLEATRYGQSGVVAALATAVQRSSRPIPA